MRRRDPQSVVLVRCREVRRGCAAGHCGPSREECCCATGTERRCGGGDGLRRWMPWMCWMPWMRRWLRHGERHRYCRRGGEGRLLDVGWRGDGGRKRGGWMRCVGGERW